MTRRASTALVPLVLAAACGGVGTPDLDVGTVKGRVVNAMPGAYVYPFGRPDLRVDVGADSQFTIARVPVETTAIVIMDGEDPANGTRRAQLVQGIEVRGAEETTLADFQADVMPLAGAILAAAQLEGGAEPIETAFTVVGTDQVDVIASLGTISLGPIPAGAFQVAVTRDGFRPGYGPTLVTAGATEPLIVSLAVDPEAPNPGCASGILCRNGLVCNPADGLCYECVSDGDCAASGGTCSGNRCVGGTTPGEICDACSSDLDCASGLCAYPGTPQSFCTKLAAPGALSCPAAFVHEQLPDGRWVCAPLSGCAAYDIAFGSTCIDDYACAQLLTGDFLAPPNVICKRASPTGFGYCTAVCLVDADCPAPGWACNASGMIYYCAPAAVSGI